MHALRSPEEFTEFAAQLHDGLEDGIETLDQEGDRARFYFDSHDSESVVARALGLPDLYDRISMTEFTELYAGQIRESLGRTADAFYETEVAILAAALIACRRNAIADREYSTAVILRQQTAPSFMGDTELRLSAYERFAAQSVSHRVEAQRAEGSFQALYANLTHASNLSAPQGVTA